MSRSWSSEKCRVPVIWHLPRNRWQTVGSWNLAWLPPYKLNAQNAVHPICKTTFWEILLISLGQLLGALAKNNSYTLLLLLSHLSCPTLCDSIDGSPPSSSIPGILQARTLECVAISLSNAWKWKVKVKSLSRVRLLETPWTEAYKAPPSMGFSGKSTGVGCHCLLRIHTWEIIIPKPTLPPGN